MFIIKLQHIEKNIKITLTIKLRLIIDYHSGLHLLNPVHILSRPLSLLIFIWSNLYQNILLSIIEMCVLRKLYMFIVVLLLDMCVVCDQKEY